MNKDQLQGSWKMVSGKVKEKWGEITDDEIDQIEGKVEQLEGLVQQRYGCSKEEAKKEVNEFIDSL
jgi:uncharacterized protein YjbJ (UPF0337 family)